MTQIHSEFYTYGDSALEYVDKFQIRINIVMRGSRGGYGGGGSLPLEFANLQSLILLEMKKIVILYVKVGPPPPWKTFLDPRLIVKITYTFYFKNNFPKPFSFACKCTY